MLTSPDVQTTHEIKLKILDNLQANILKFHRRREAYHLFVRFTKGIENKIKTWIQGYAQEHVTSAARQVGLDSENGGANNTGELLSCFFLSAAGYRALGYLNDHLREQPFQDSSFLNGMKMRQNYYFKQQDQWWTIDNKDPLYRDWQDFYRGEIHAMLLLAQDANENELRDKVVSLQRELKSEGIAEEVWIEHGQRLFDDNGEDIEHFGYRDGISNPSFFFREIPINQVESFNLSAAEDLVLIPDLLANEKHCYGSYLVFRKLEQNTTAFAERVRQHARDNSIEAQELAGAEMVGRFTDGTPLTMFNQRRGVDTNDFTFKDDDGSRCPLFAHIRKVNPRDGSEHNTQIVRRGIPYSETEEGSDSRVGLLFMCYQRSIHDQFEFIQRHWIDNHNHPVMGTGVDRLIGQKWSEKTDLKYPVTLKGGEYFFAPSLSFLKIMP